MDVVGVGGVVLFGIGVCVVSLIRKLMLVERQRRLAERVELIFDDLEQYGERFARIEPELRCFTLSLGPDALSECDQVRDIQRRVTEYLEDVSRCISSGKRKQLRRAEIMLGTGFGRLPFGKRMTRVSWTAEFDGHLKQLAQRVIEARQNATEAGLSSVFLRRPSRFQNGVLIRPIFLNWN